MKRPLYLHKWWNTRSLRLAVDVIGEVLCVWGLSIVGDKLIKLRSILFDAVYHTHYRKEF